MTVHVAPPRPAASPDGATQDLESFLAAHRSKDVLRFISSSPRSREVCSSASSVSSKICFES